MSYLRAAFLICVTFPTSVVGSILYHVTDLGLTNGTGVNASGQVSGFIYPQVNLAHTAIWSNGNVTDLGSGSTISEAFAINNAGQLAGFSYGYGSEYQAVIWTVNSRTNLGTLGGAYSNAQGINNLGEAVGTSQVAANSSSHGFVYANGSMTDLGTLGGAGSDAFGINDLGQIVGSSQELNSGSTPYAFLYANGSMEALPGLAGIPSQAYAINNSGQVVGSAGNYGFLDTNGSVTTIGTFGGQQSAAEAINNLGQTVGYADDASGSNQAFLYSNGVLTNLNTLIDPSLGLDLREATAINDQGQIVVEEYSGPQGQGNMYAYLLTPVAATPEPSYFWLAGSLVAVAILRRRMGSRC